VELRRRRRFSLNADPSDDILDGESQPQSIPMYDRVIIRGGKVLFGDSQWKADQFEYLARRTNLKISMGLWIWQCDNPISAHTEGFPCPVCRFVRFVPGEYPPGLADEVRVTHELYGEANYFAILSPTGGWTVYQIYDRTREEPRGARS